MKRSLLALALLSLCGFARAQSIPLGEIVSGDRSIRDPLYGVTARYPAGWSVRGVTRWGNRETTIFFGAPGLSNAFATLYYHLYPAPAALPAAPETFLRDQAERKAEQRVIGGLADYANVVNSFEYKTIGGQPALSYSARFTGGGKTQSEYFVRIISATGVALFFLRAPLDEFEQLRSAFDVMVESMHLP
jgi:hypothetical protein